MELIKHLIDLVLHLDKHLVEIAQQYGTATYGILAAIVFAETGLVVTPFLPGDSLLFATGALAASGALDVNVAFVLLFVMAVLGDGVNYHVGRFLGPKVLVDGYSRFIKKSYLDRTHAFFERYGGKTVVFARFVPIVRTFAPFIAGVGAMTYPKFLMFNVVGALAWVGSLLYAGYFFGGMEVVKKNFSLVVLAIIVLSVLPAVFEGFKAWKESQKAAPQS